MAVLKIGDQQVTVDDTFMSLPPEQQQATVDEIEGSLAKSAPKTVGGFVKDVWQTAPPNTFVGMAKGAWDTIQRGGKMFSGEIDPTSDEGIRTAGEAALLATPLPPGMRGTSGFRPQMAKKRVEPPTASALSEAGGAQYNAVRELDPLYRQDAVKGMGDRVRTQLENAGIYADRAPETFKHLPKFDQASPGAVSTFDNLHHARETFQDIAVNFNAAPRDRKAATTVIKAIDDFLEKPSPSSVVARSPTDFDKAVAAGETYGKGRANIAASHRVNEVTGELDKAISGALPRADIRATTRNSGFNFDNNIRAQAQRVLEDPSSILGLKPDEVALWKALAEGSGGRNTARYVGNALGGGGGLGAMATSGVLGAALGPVGYAGGPVIGAGSRMIANQMARQEAEKLAAELAKRSPLYQDQLGTIARDPHGREMLVRALMSGAVSANQQ